MKISPYDYSDFRLSRINEPRFRHLWLLSGWVFYFAMYFLTENLIPREACHPIHCALDDLIPFNEFFLIFYCAWFFLVFGSLLYTMLYDVPSFKKLQIFLIVTQVVAMICYVVYPSRQDLRPEVFLRDNLLTRLMGFIYAFDTSTGVCPSLHVAYSLGILSVFLKKKNASRLFKGALVTFIAMICVSVCFVKQHSAVDVLAALLLGLLAEIITYGHDFWREKLTHKKKTPSV